MIPYIHVPDLPVAGPVTLHPFGLLVATGVVLGTWITTRRAAQRGLDTDQLNSFITWMLIFGFVGGHVFDAIFYHPEKIKADPLYLIKIWESLSSFGGFLGAGIGIFLWKYFETDRAIVNLGLFTLFSFKRRKTPAPIMPLADLIISVFPVAWIFGRGGCAVVHDHKGAVAPAGHWLAVGYPVREADFIHNAKGITGEVVWNWGPLQFVKGLAPHFDLGLLEWFFTVLLSVFLVISWRRKLPTGTYLSVVTLAYAPIRFLMDFFRLPDDGHTGDLRFGALTFAQYACIALFFYGLYAAWNAKRLADAGDDPLDFYKLAPKKPKKKAKRKSPEAATA
jgi:phosphatidylglycerol:prolipoprotein diacylglycerol transferase